MLASAMARPIFSAAERRRTRRNARLTRGPGSNATPDVDVGPHAGHLAKRVEDVARAHRGLAGGARIMAHSDFRDAQLELRRFGQDFRVDEEFLGLDVNPVEDLAPE